MSLHDTAPLGHKALARQFDGRSWGAFSWLDSSNFDQGFRQMTMFVTFQNSNNCGRATHPFPCPPQQRKCQATIDQRIRGESILRLD